MHGLPGKNMMLDIATVRTQKQQCILFSECIECAERPFGL